MKPSEKIRMIINQDRLRYGVDDNGVTSVAQQMAVENGKLIDAIVKYLDDEHDKNVSREKGNYYPEGRDTAQKNYSPTLSPER